MRSVWPVTAIADLRGRLAELADLAGLGALADWDQQVMMPRGGATARAHQMAALDRLLHELGTSDELGAWLDELDSDAGELDELDRDIVRVARRDFERQRSVPTDLVGERAQAAAEGQGVWRKARADADFAAFAPALRRNVELARAYAACFADAPRAYDSLLNDFDYGVPTERVQAVFSSLADGLRPLIDEGGNRSDWPAALEIPVAAQRVAVASTLRRIGVNEESWRVDVSPHPFSEAVSRRDTRVTTRYENGSLESLIGALHEFGHALYEQQIAEELERTNLGHGTSMSIHESQSKLWENHVAHSRAFAPVLAEELGRGGYPVEPDALYDELARVRPSLIRVSSDQVTYPLHIILRFELEVALIEDDLDADELPGAWNDGMQRLLGVEVPDDGVGVLQDIHWSAGLFGYFPSYAMGCLIAAQLWQQLESELGSQDDSLSLGEVAAIRDWLAERVHRHGRRLDTVPLVEQATGRGIDVAPFLAHAAAVVSSQRH
jgi:carboxypeptidase Taq